MVPPMKKSALLLISATAITLSSCNTFVGFGRDVKSLGTGMENTAYGKKWSGEERAQKSQQPAVQPQPAAGQ